MSSRHELLRWMLAGAFLTATAGTVAAGECKEHIELHGGAYWAKELGKSEMWVLANHQINVWQSPSPNKGRKIGQMRVGSRAEILESTADDYKIRSPLDGSVGWVGKVQVARTLWQDTETFKPCKAAK